MKRSKLLNIEDEPYLSRIAKDTLELKGSEVTHKKDGTRKLDLVQSFQPFRMEELIVRVENQLRISAQVQQNAVQEDEITLGRSKFFPAKYELQIASTSIKLSHRESQVLKLICRHRNQTLDRKRLLQLVWGDDSFFSSRDLDVYIRKLRKYFVKDAQVEIITLKDVGYFFRTA